MLALMYLAVCPIITHVRLEESRKLEELLAGHYTCMQDKVDQALLPTSGITPSDYVKLLDARDEARYCWEQQRGTVQHLKHRRTTQARLGIPDPITMMPVHPKRLE